MARTSLDFQYRDKDYSLAYNIEVVKRLDKSGLLAQIANGEHPLTMTEDLFVAAFEANHPTVSNNIRKDIYAEFSDSSDDGSLLECLFEMLNETRESMKPKGNVKWRMNRE